MAANQYMKLVGDNKDIIKKDIDGDYIKQIAKSILNKHKLKVGDKTFRFAEIEFYVRNNTHKDEYTHMKPEQLEYGKWYFHKTGSGYKGGTFKGLDMTFGLKESNCYFGVLIRALNCIDDDTYYCGPCVCVNKILELCNVNSIKEYVDNYDVLPLDIESEDNIHVLYDDNLTEEAVYAGPRIGLSDKYEEYHNKPYRFIIMKNKAKKRKRTLVEI